MKPQILSEQDPKKLGYCGKVPGSKSRAAWCTPQRYVDLVDQTLGGIDYRPTDFDSTPWPSVASLFIDPACSLGRFSRGQVVDKVIAEYEKGTFKRGIILANSNTDTKWFDNLNAISCATCFTRGRIAFEDEAGRPIKGNTVGQVFMYIGPDVDRFMSVFKPVGNTLKSIKSIRRIEP